MNELFDDIVMGNCRGKPGAGLPPGGDIGQIPAKKSGADFDVEWVDPPVGGGTGTPGEKGEPGADGKSAYEIWLEQGNAGTVQDFLDSLKGEQGEPGVPGAQGEPGESGGGFNWRGAFQIGNTYDKNDVVVGSDGDEYIARADGLVLPPPSPGWDLHHPAYTTSWDKISGNPADNAELVAYVDGKIGTVADAILAITGVSL